MNTTETLQIVNSFWADKPHSFEKRGSIGFIEKLQGQFKRPFPESLVDYLNHLPEEDYTFELEVYVEESIILFGTQSLNFLKAPFNLIPETTEKLGGWNEDWLVIGMQKGETDIPHPIIINLGNLEEGINILENWDYREVAILKKKEALTWEYKAKIANTLPEFLLGTFAFHHATHKVVAYDPFKEPDDFSCEQALGTHPAFWFYPNMVKWIDREAADNWNKVFGLHYNSEEGLDEYL